ncbi:MAG TPA: hypothetical protein VHM70_30520 [Polyangiaceae bacterium]|jgi:hypothetical protein|nr:hypothetical protein [Polyangiaceae bacterium]
MNKLIGVIFVLGGALAMACGPSAPQPSSADAVQTPLAASSAPAAQPVQLPDHWQADMSDEQKAEFMKQRVVPAMAPVFKEADPVRYANFDCKTCHGPEFKDPKEFLPHLTVQGNQLTAFTEDPDMAKFMAEKVTPAMVHALGVEPFDPATMKGFGCGGCHTVDVKP